MSALSGRADCDTPGVSRKQRQIERVVFRVDELEKVVACMARLSSAEDGWINLIPRINNDDERPTSLRFFTLFSGGATGDTMCTWIPGSHNRRGVVQPSLGIAHVTGHRVFAGLHSLGVPIPPTWIVDQDHPRRGLVLRVPSDEPDEQVLTWALAAAGALIERPMRGWRADVYLPVNS